MDNVYLFVYGTLRKDFGLALMQEVAEKLVFIGHGSIYAALYDLGSYPAAIKEIGKNEVRGDIFSVIDAEEVFTLLDTYEGMEYRREKTIVKVDDGCTLTAWVYWYAGEPIDDALRIVENDYFDYLKNKKIA